MAVHSLSVKDTRAIRPQASRRQIVGSPLIEVHPDPVYDDASNTICNYLAGLTQDCRWLTLTLGEVLAFLL
jgi:hypothetical protein